MIKHNVTIGNILEGDLSVPQGAQATILFAHGSGSDRHSARNGYVAQTLNDRGFATLLVDLLTPEEKEIDAKTRHLRFNIEFLSSRLVAATDWLIQEPETRSLKIGYFGSSTGAAAALISSAKVGDAVVRAIVSRSGRPDLVEPSMLQNVAASVLLIVGGRDRQVIGINSRALKQLAHAKARELVIIPGATHLFEEPGKMEEVTKIAAEWFECYLLKNSKKFENKSSQKASGLFSLFKEKPHIQIRFKDRAAAGDMLASLLSKYKNSQNVTVIGIPRGGVVVADEVARKLNADFDIVIPRKLRAPDSSENAIGAIMQDGSVYLDSNLVGSTKVSKEYLDMEKSEQLKEIERRMRLYRPEPKEYDIRGRTVILVDDGAATGATIITAARWIRRQEPQLLVIGVPVAPQHIQDLLKAEADHVEVISKPSSSKFKTVEQYYQNFSPVADEQTIQIVREGFAKMRERNGR
jgi:putative phosphoribosyl transferase